jgi:ABC-type nitrate/sulfonate/bicarbonate transport system substrate-binding protein
VLPSLLLSLPVFLVMALGVSTSWANDRVRIGWAAMTASHTPLWVAQERGLLARQGLFAEPIFSAPARRRCKPWSPAISTWS